MNKAGERLYNGLVKENPTFVLMLGMCPTLAVTTSAMNGLGMGLTTMVVLALSNLIISLLRNLIPNRVRIPAFIVIIASFVTAVQLLLEAYIPSLNKSLGVYIPLIVVNCIILGRAESYAYSNPPVPSLFDGIGMGLGFTFALTCIGAVRELIGAGELFGFGVMPNSFEPVRIFGQAPGAFFVLAALVALQNYIKNDRKKKGKSYEKIGSGCTEDCANCGDMNCKKRFYDTDSVDKRSQAAEHSPKETPLSESSSKEKKVSKETPLPESTLKEKKVSKESPLPESASKEKKVSKESPLPENTLKEKKANKESPLTERTLEEKKVAKENQEKKTGKENQVHVSVPEESGEEGLAFEELQDEGSKEVPAFEGLQEESEEEELAFESLSEESGEEGVAFESLQEENSEKLVVDSLQEQDSEGSMEYESLQDAEESQIGEKAQTAEKEER